MDQDSHAQNKPRPSVINWVGKTLSSNKDSNKASIVDQPFLQNKVSRKGAALSGESSAVEETPADSISTNVSSSLLNMNIRKEKYNCRFCDKPFQWYSHWQAHERIHTGERPYKCDECDKAFTRSDGLQCHKLTHVPRECSSTLSLGDTKYIANSFQYKHCEEDKLMTGIFMCTTSSCSSSHAQHIQVQKGVFCINVCFNDFIAVQIGTFLLSSGIFSIIIYI